MFYLWRMEKQIMKNIKITLIFLIITSIYISQTNAQPPAWDRAVIAEIMRENSIKGAHDAMKNNQSLYLNYQYLLIEQEIAQEAVKLGLCERMDVIHKLQNSRRTILVNAMKEDILRKMPDPPMVELQVYYNKHLNQYTLPETFKIDVFEIDTNNDKLMGLVKNLKTSKQFDLQELLQAGAKKIMTESKTNWFTEKQIHKKIFLALQKMKNLDMQLVKLNSSLFLVHRINYREKVVRPFKHVLNDILVKIKNAQAEAVWQDYLQNVKKRLAF